MKIRDFYDRTGGDFAGAMQRLMKEDRLEKYVRMFLNDTSYGELESCLARNDVPGAFRAVHTLKGVCLNLSFTRLYESVNAATEALRYAGADSEKDMAQVTACMQLLRRDYSEVTEAIRSLDS